MHNFDLPQFRHDFFVQHDQPDPPFSTERPPIFTSAAPAQDRYNASRVWRRWGDTFIAWQYGELINEASAVHSTALLGDWSAISKVAIEGRDDAAIPEGWANAGGRTIVIAVHFHSHFLPLIALERLAEPILDVSFLNVNVYDIRLAPSMASAGPTVRNPR